MRLINPAGNGTRRAKNIPGETPPGARSARAATPTPRSWPPQPRGVFRSPRKNLKGLTDHFLSKYVRSSKRMFARRILSLLFPTELQPF